MRKGIRKVIHEGELRTGISERALCPYSRLSALPKGSKNEEEIFSPTH